MALFLALVVLTLALVFLPGAAIGWTIGLRRLALAATAPVLSVSIISVAAVLAHLVGLSWGIVPVLVVTAIGVACAWVVRRLTRSMASGAAKATRLAGAATPASRLRAVVLAWLPLVLAAGLATWQVSQMLPGVSAFSQTYDNIYHMNLVRWILDHGNASSLSAGAMTNGVGGFYPAAWHDIITLGLVSVGSDAIAVGTNALIWVVMALVWPLAVLFLVGQILPDASALLRVVTGIAASSFAAFPSLLIGFGVLYPNFLGFALLPVLVGWAVLILRIVTPAADVPLPTAIVLLMACLPGLFLAHPNAVLSLMAIVSPMGLVWCFRGVRATWGTHRARAWGYVAATSVTLAIFAIMWWLGFTIPTWGPPNTSEASIGEVLLASPLLIRPFWVLGLLIVVGLVTMVLRASLRWWCGPTLVIVALWWAASAMSPGLLRNLLVAGYYADPFRLAALLPLVLAPVVVIGADAVLSAVHRGIQAVLKSPPDAWRLVAEVAALVVLVGGVQFSPAMSAHEAWVRGTYVLDDSRLVDADEMAVLQQLPAIVPDGVRVATDPWNGSSMAYALEGVLTTTTHVTTTVTPELAAINQYLNLAGTSPALVCPAIKSLNVGFVLDFGTVEVHGAHHPYPGFANLATAKGFVPVVQHGSAVLYRIDACN